MSDEKGGTDEELTKLVSLEGISQKNRKCIAGIVACLIDGASDELTGEMAPETDWIPKLFKDFCQYLELPEVQVDSLSPMLKLESDPTPFYDAMGDEWIAEDKQIRIILLVLHFAILDQGYYDSRVRRLLRKMAIFFQLHWKMVEINENVYGQALMKVLQERAEVDQEKAKKKKYKRWFKIGAGAVIGGGLLAITGGLAAPALGAGFVALGLGSTATFIGSTAGFATIATVFGVGGAGLTGYKVNKRVADVKEFQFERITEVPALPLVIGVSGWITKQCGFGETWSDTLMTHFPMSESYFLQWESEDLKALGTGMETFITTKVVSTAVTESLKQTLLSAMLAALAWPTTLLAVAEVIDNPWSLTMSKAKQAGLLLADALTARAHGGRPVTLIGFSMGARVIFYCLEELARRQERYQAYVNAQKEQSTKKSDGNSKSRSNSKAEKNFFSNLLSKSEGNTPSNEPPTCTTKPDDSDTAPAPSQTSHSRSNSKTEDGFFSNLFKKSEQESAPPEGTQMSSTKLDDASTPVPASRQITADAKSSEISTSSGTSDDSDAKIEADSEEIPLPTAGLLDNVILLGAPCTANTERWEKFRPLVAGRLVNGYCKTDWILGFVYRTAEVSVNVAGLSPVEGAGVENVDLSDIVSGHAKYAKSLHEILNYAK